MKTTIEFMRWYVPRFWKRAGDAIISAMFLIIAFVIWFFGFMGYF
jgi:hypothetical protein